MPYIQIDDIRIHFADQGQGNVLLLVHAFPLNHTSWDNQLQELSQDHRVIAPDMRGFGATEVTEGTVTMARMADDLALLLTALQVDQPVVLCGLSMGGYVAWEMWRCHRERLSGMILCDTAAADAPEVARGRELMADQVFHQGTSEVADTMLPRLLASETIESQPELVESVKQMINETSPMGIAAAQRGMAQRTDFSDKLGEMTLPVLVLCGEHDAISRCEEMKSITASLPSAAYVEIPTAGHLAPMEQPQLVNRAIHDFLRDAHK